MCVCVCERERERGGEREREGGRECVCVCVCEREREREGEASLIQSVFHKRFHCTISMHCYVFIMYYRVTQSYWVNGLTKLFVNCRPACEWFIEFLASGENYIKSV